MSMFFELAKRANGRIQHHSTVGGEFGSKRLQIYFSVESRQRFVITEERVGKSGRHFTNLKEEPPGKSLLVIQGECEHVLASELHK